MSDNARLKAALAHAAHLRAVLPVYWSSSGRCGCGRSECHSAAKHPIPELVPRGVKHATTSRIVIRAWWAYAPLANPAVATGEDSHLFVLDVDGDHGGFDSLRALEGKREPLPRTQRVLTASGEHIYFSYPGVHLKNTVGKLGPGLDVRCCGGYVVAVGAVHRSGHVYVWKDGHRPDQVALAKPPNWLVDRLLTPQPRPPLEIQSRNKGRAASALADEERQLLATPVGLRNNRLNLAAFRLAQYVAMEAPTRGDIEAVLLDAAARLGIPEREAAATIASGMRAGLKLSVNTRFRD